MASYLKDADVIVSAVGKPGLVTKDVLNMMPYPLNENVRLLLMHFFEVVT
jgi:hypothetical protein